MGEIESDPIRIFDLFGDNLSRRILILASEQPLSADELATTLDASHPTIYRRINALLDYDLVREEQHIDADGNHYKTFETTLNRIAIEVDDGGYTVDIRMRQNLVDQFGDFWSDLGESDLGGSIDPDTTDEASDGRYDHHHG